MSDIGDSRAVLRNSERAGSGLAAVPEASNPDIGTSRERRIAAERMLLPRALAGAQIDRLPPASRAAIREAHRRLSIRGAEVHVVTTWWGFEIHLNPQAAECSAELVGPLGDILAEIPRLAPLVPRIRAFCIREATRIAAAGTPYGCRLISPWDT